MFERFKSLPEIWRSGRLALRLLRDPRVPMAAKALFGVMVVYMLSPLDIVPDWMPVVGQADDIVVLMAGLNLFLRACPKWLVEEHEDAIGTRPKDHPDREDRPDRPRATAGAPYGSPIEGEYERIR
jgi:uncharacterized membrane protein YkvA (DUF1232 family)